MRNCSFAARRRCAVIVALGLFTGARVARTQSTEPTPTGRAAEEHVILPPPGLPGAGGGQGVAIAPPPLPSPQTDVKNVPASGSLPDPSRSSANAGVLRGAQLVSIRDGEVTLVLDGANRTLRVGSTIGGDIVRRIDSDRLVLGRPEGSREGLVIVTFDAQRHARVRVYATTDPNPAAPLPVK